MKSLSTLLFGLIFLNSCDCFQIVNGTIIDRNSKEPISGISVYKKNDPQYATLTDEGGGFEITDISGGLFGCPPMTIVVKHVDYETQIIEIPSGRNLTIEIKKNFLEKTSTIDLLQGRWVHNQDSLASVEIHNHQWSFNNIGEPASKFNNYSISLREETNQFAKDSVAAEFMILTNEIDTMKYEILGVSNSSLSLLFYPSGRIHLYDKKE